MSDREAPVLSEPKANISELQYGSIELLAIAPEAKEQETIGTSQKPQEAIAQNQVVELNDDVDKDTELRFSVQFYRISEKLAIINEVPFLRSSSNEQDLNKLLTAILRALGQEFGESPNSVRFNWPLGADDDASSRRASEAFQALSGFMRKRLGSDSYKVILVFGNQCEELFDKSGVGDLLTETSERLIHTHSLDAILRVPSLKRSVWDSIRVIPALLN